MPVRRNRPSASVVTRDPGPSGTVPAPDQVCPCPAVGEVLRPGHRRLPGGEVSSVEAMSTTGRTETPGTGRPSRSTTRPTIGTSSRTSLRVTSLASSAEAKEAQAGPNPGAIAATVGWPQVALPECLEARVGRASSNRPSPWLIALGGGRVRRGSRGPADRADRRRPWPRRTACRRGRGHVRGSSAILAPPSIGRRAPGAPPVEPPRPASRPRGIVGPGRPAGTRCPATRPIVTSRVTTFATVRTWPAIRPRPTLPASRAARP